MRQDRTIIILHETLAKSLITDAASYVMIVGVIGTGWWLGSSAMQWMGFAMLCLTSMARVGAKSKRITPQQAADILWKDFGVKSKGS